MTEVAARNSVQQANTLEVSLVFGIHDIGSIECRSIRCDVLPWIHESSDIQDTLKAAVERKAAEFWSEAESSIKSNWRAKSAKQKLNLHNYWQDFRKLIAEVLGGQMVQYQIDVHFVVDVMMEQRIGDLAPPGSTPAWLTWKAFDSVLKENGKTVARNDVRVVSKEMVAFSPDAKVDNPFIDLQVAKKLRLEEITLRKSDKTLAKSSVADVLEEGESNRIRLPTLPMSCYHLLTESKGHQPKLDVQLSFLGGSEVVLDMPVEVPVLDGAPIVLFIDLGSTTSKMVRVRLNPFRSRARVPKGFDKWSAKELERQLGSLNVDRTVATAFEPEPTGDFVQRWKLPAYNKAKLVQLGEEALARWFERAARNFASGLANKKMPLVKIYWSFPAVAGVNIEELREMMTATSSTWMLGTAELVTEHEALRHRYEKTLELLGNAAAEQKNKKERAESKNRSRRSKKKALTKKYEKEKREYDNKNKIFRFFSSKPEKPNLSKYAGMSIPELAAWHAKFLDLSISSQLDEFFIVDAGGFTLDVYIKRKGREPVGYSVPAGGEELTRRVEEYLKEKRDGVTKDLREMAERDKIETCIARSDSTLGRKIRVWTEEIYEPAVDEALREGLKGVKKSSLKGIPLVLSGGAMRNPWLVELLRDNVRDLGINTLEVDSESLTEELTTFGLEEPVLTRFELATSGYAVKKNKLDLRFDIVGGLVELVARDGN